MPHPLDRIRKAMAVRLPVAALMLFACNQTDPVRIAGTSTSVGTSIGGTALLSDGRPAAGARVTARSEAIAFTAGRPESPILAEARADSSGRYSLHGVAKGYFSLEIECDPDAGCAVGSEEGFYSRIYAVTPSRPLPTARLAAPGSLRGVLGDAPGDTDSVLWIGIAGTAHFTAAERSPQGGWAFRLDKLYEGDYRLTLAGRPDTAWDSTAQKTGAFSIRSGYETELGP